MSMGSGSGRVVPPLTVRVARASNPQGTAAMWVRDRLDELFVDADFAEWYPADGRRGVSPARLALVSVLQYAENLTDRQAARAVRCRIDWKYCLGLELDDPGFDYSVLSEFRDRMAEDGRADRLLAVMVERLAAAGLVKRRGRVRTDSTHVLAAVRTLNRVELVGETLRAALEELAGAGEEWLAALVTPAWAERYGRPVRYDRLPQGKEELASYVLQVGEDGMVVLRAVYAADAPPRFRDLEPVQILRQVWVQQYWFDAVGRLQWRGPKSTRDRQSRRATERRNTAAEAADGRPDPGTARVPWSGMEIVSPHDAEARFCLKAGKAKWIGYRDHQTETCDETSPRVVVQVVTDPAPEQDIEALDRIHRGLAAQGIHPREHLVDGGYISPGTIHRAAQQWAITLVGPVRVAPGQVNAPGSPKVTFASTGRPAPPPVHAASPVRHGNRPWATGIPDCRCSSPAKPAESAKTGSSAPAISTAKAATSSCCPSPSTRSRPESGPNSRPRNGSSDTQCGPDAKPPSPRQSTPTACATAATEASPRPTSSTS
jgi:transposase